MFNVSSRLARGGAVAPATARWLTDACTFRPGELDNEKQLFSKEIDDGVLGAYGQLVHSVCATCTLGCMACTCKQELSIM